MSAAPDRFFDSHCHIDAPVFDRDRAERFARAHDVGVSDVFVPGTDPTQWERMSKLRSEPPGAPRLHFGVGLHPYRLAALDENALSDALASLPARARALGAVAVGECGVDAPHAKRLGPSVDVQLEVLAAQLGIAQRLSLPVVLHVVRAHGRVLELLRQETPSRGGILHAYSGAAELVPLYAELGFYFGFGAACLHPGRRRIHEAILRVPLPRLLVETDAPDQPPPGKLGPNEPAEVLGIATEIAARRGLPLAEFARLTHENARTAFGIGTS